MVSACNIEDVPSYGGSAFSDIVGGTNASYTGFSQIGGSKKRRRTKRKKGKRTKHCKCKICKCKKCRCNKNHSRNKIGGSSRPGYVAGSEEDVMRLYNQAMEREKKERSEKSFDDAERQLDALRKKGVNAARDTDIMEYVKQISDKKSPRRNDPKRSSPRRSSSRRSDPKRSSPRRSDPKRSSSRRSSSSGNSITRFFRSLSEYYGRPKRNSRPKRTNSRPKRTTSIPKRTTSIPKRTNSGPKVDTDERARKHEELLKQFGLRTDEQIGEYIDKSKKSVKKRESKDKNIISEVRPIDNRALDYKLTGNKFKIINVGGDGNCFFRSISHLIFGNENKHDVIRKNMVKWVHENRKKLINKNIVSLGGSEDTGHSVPFCWFFQAQLSDPKMYGVSREDKEYVREIEPLRNSNYYSVKDQNRLIDIYCKTMGTLGVWAYGKLEFYFVCNALNKYHNEKIRMILYTFPCPKNPDYEANGNRGDPCLEYIPSLGRHVREFCTTSIEDPITTIFNRGEPGLKDIHVLNMGDLHYTALESS